MKAPAVQTSPRLQPVYRQRLERVKLSLNRSSGRSALPEWMCNNLKDPKNPTKPWSFKDHEYQPGILSCEASHIAVKKSSQVGVSEMSAREILGLMSLIEGSHWIYSLQTTGYARKFTTARMDPAIEASEMLTRLRHRDVDSTELKRIGNSFLYMVGAQRTGQAISIPCRGVIRDEVDFCNQTALTSLLSRLTHNDPGTEILQDFSTPTLPEYGIDKTFKAGSQHVYMVYHEKCGQWVIVDPAFDMVLPGFDENLIKLTKADLADPRVRPERAYVKCRCCGNEITRANLMNPVLRAWVQKHPDRELKSFYVSPLDVPRYNTPEKIIRAVENYNRADDWINFALGHAHLGSGSAVSPEALEMAAVGAEVAPAEGVMYGAALGLDVGKTCHLTVLSPHGNKLVVHRLERIKQKINADGTDEVSETVIERARQYGVTKGVVDGGPDVTIPPKIINGCRYHVMWASYFVRQIKGLDNYTLDGVEQTINLARTSAIDEMVGDLNGGKFIFPKNSSETEILIAHLKKLRRVRRISENTGEESAAWITLDDDDHYAFSLLYAYTAWKLQTAGVASVTNLPAGLIVAKTRLPGVKSSEPVTAYPY